MANSNGCKVVLLLVLAVLIGSAGFASGFVVRWITMPDRAVVVVEPQDTAAPTAQPLTPTREEPTMTPPVAGDEQGLELFWEVWQIIQGEYYGDLPNQDELTYGAIRGAVNTLGDPYTAFVEPQVAAIMREDQSGSFEGIGALVSMDDGILSIVSVYEDQPAQKAGLRGGDVIAQVDGTPIENMSIYEAISLIRGPAGTTVRLKILRKGEEAFEVEIVRAKIDIQLVQSEMRDDGIGYVWLFQFDNTATAKLANEIDELLAQNPKGLILDLRGNPGGLLNESILTAGLFLPQDTEVLIERFKDGTERPYTTSDGPIAPDIPLVVLVDVGSASASEIVAGALQDYGRAVLIGDKTFGKGSVQLLHELSNGSELRVTVARWFTPKGRAIHGEGLDPDIEVVVTREDIDAERDPQLDRAIEYLLTGK
ncbi:MAG: S41 family peptidase [Anaerolineae bacterium]|nr:S41 family peptidase [Anaerolineae bacterium]